MRIARLAFFDVTFCVSLVSYLGAQKPHQFVLAPWLKWAKNLFVSWDWTNQRWGMTFLTAKSIDQRPFELGTTRDALGTTPEGGILLGPERHRTYEDLSDTEKKRYDADVQATNIVLQGLPKGIYKLLASSELTKEDRESQLYDEFERFKMLP
ncbi:hypothetical protein Tco_1268677, partial [Tanacetum coccineum]